MRTYAMQPNSIGSHKNHIDINIDKLTQLKIPTIESPAEELNDVGFDGVSSNYESGCIGDDEYPLGYGISYTSILEAENIAIDSSFFVQWHFPDGEEELPIAICGQAYWNDDNINCTTCSSNDPNGDDFSPENPGGKEGNDKYDQSDKSDI